MATATGTLSATDVDNAATFVVQSNAAKSYGTFSIDALGAWSYTLSIPLRAFRGATLSDVRAVEFEARGGAFPIIVDSFMFV